ncbi:MAG: hypothetical protein K2M59_04590 [Muribaculaceae bacterium]|nr:hypothetical protein [Muribaculaceae bacterium]
MRKVLSLLAFLLCVSNAWSILYKCDDFNTSKKTCSLVGWGGTQPTSGKLKLPSTFTHTDGVTYTITKVAKHALDNLTTVTEITIPAEYVWFGNVHDTQVVNSTTENFFNCPKLVRFIVDAKSPIFETTPKGLLLLKGKKELIKVPQSFETTGNLTIPDGIEYISEEALVENLTITSLKIPQNVEIFKNGGISSTKFGDVKFVRLFYTIDGHQMSTDYFPTSWISTGIDEPESEVDVEGAGEIYDLLGRKVESLKKGIYLVKKNGKFVKSAN